MSTEHGHTDKIRSESLHRLYFSLSLPAAFSLLVLGLYHFFDGIFIGQWVNPEALGAVGLVYPFTLVNNGIFMLIGIGSASLLSRAIGAKDRETIDSIFGNLLLLNVLLSGIQLFIGLMWAEEIVAFLGGEGVMLEYGTRYLRIIVIGSPFINFASSANVLIRGEGRMRSAMLIMSSGAVLNLVLDPVFLGVLDFGVEGAAAATAISQGVTAAVSVFYFLKGKSVVRISPSRFRFTRHLGEILSVGVSGMALPVMTIVQIVFVIKSTAYYGGSRELIIISALIKILNFIFVPIWGACQGFQPLVGINYGAADYHRVRRGFFVFVFYTSLIALAVWSLIMGAPRLVLGWFITDAAIVESGVRVIRLYLCDFPLYGYMLLVVTLFQALGKGGHAAFLVVSRMSLLFIPIILLLPRVLGIDGVWLATPVSDGLVVIVGTVMAVRELRRQRRLEREVYEEGSASGEFVVSPDLSKPAEIFPDV
ncbi:MAG: MATE family efflux transporter [Spirochaetaceae bacterium]